MYDNFALLLNTIREALCLDTESSFFASLVFHGHDKPMYDGIKSSYPPKPDIIALLRSIEQCSGMNALLALLSVLDLENVGDRENWDNGFTATRSKGASEKKGGDLEEHQVKEEEMEHEDKGDNKDTDYVTPDKERMPWAALDLVLEFKNKFPLLFVQLTTYARAMFAVRPYRYFVSTLAFQQVKRYVTFIFFHRGGSVLSHDLYLTTKTGFSTFVRHLCGMLSWSFANAGMESSRSLRYHFLRVNGRCVV